LNKGDSQSGVAGVVGSLGIAFGFWWTDAAAAASMSVEIIKDGYTNLRNSLSQLMNRRRSSVEDQKEDPANDRLQNAMEQLDERDLLERMAQARTILRDVDWRLYDISMVPVRSVN
jgi:divalent metal cation (Fe/Co/Zn/Cd) transporter